MLLQERRLLLPGCKLSEAARRRVASSAATSERRQDSQVGALVLGRRPLAHPSAAVPVSS
eukprot:CAMPEP_0168457468 /NCGR_PEP_ID=MMETSP0228-20121227/51850_1 /TAXON_ID=133427 /ORGANISM="Protoceratium reticulatum, Strain CCCM 535 (=CCMP 1889)" /LENGTH=59 /DNA_ID=CAMNT_0008472483 /DNA_START=56 /DNA_END=232 /DNA_ORIENTATION=-